MHRPTAIYLDHHATTPCDPRVVAAMVPMLTEHYANIHSTVHEFGREAKRMHEEAMESIARSLGCTADELVLTSGATESNNLAILGFALHPRQTRRGVITVVSEHPAVLDPIASLEGLGFQVTRLPILPQGDREGGRIDLDQLRRAINGDTALVSIMLANNEIGVIQDLPSIAQCVHAAGAVLHTDATQAVGKIPVDVDALDVDLLSASAHKFYGPKGIGLLYVRRHQRRIRLRPQILGGGQQRGLRSGTINSAGSVAMATALALCDEEIAAGEDVRLRLLAERFRHRIAAGIGDLQSSGPAYQAGLRLGGNLNLCFPEVEGESLLAAIPGLGASSGAACSSVDPRPSHVLTSLGLSESAARRSLRFGLGRFTTETEIDTAAEWICEAYLQLSPKLSGHQSAPSPAP